MDRKDYTVVGENFIKGSGFIANKLGKVKKGIELFEKIERSCKVKMAFKKPK